MDSWNPWHGCKKYSEGCLNCYVFRRDESVGRDASNVYRTSSFDLPLRRSRNGEYKIAPNSEIFSCMTSDFFLEDADCWRGEAWDIIRGRPDVTFSIITKRIVRFKDCLPADWGDGYDNVRIGCTVENQKQADIRLPVFMSLPIKRKFVCCEPLLGKINLEEHIDPSIELLAAGGESGPGARVCSYSWVLDLREQCIRRGVRFWFKQTGANFEKNGLLYKIPRRLQSAQARRAGIDI